MIIFDLDGTLADCEHRRHFVTHPKYVIYSYHDPSYYFPAMQEEAWKPDWDSFYEDCDKDTPIETIISLWNNYVSLGCQDICHIWSGRSEKVKEKTLNWLDYNLLCFNPANLKMRPINDFTSDDKLKEKWLDESLAQGNHIEIVFDDRKKVVNMWRRRGLTCLQVADGDF